MSGHATKWLGLCGLVLAFAACRPLPQVGVPGEGKQADLQALPGTDVVPAEWGRLIAVTEKVAGSHIMSLWFQSDSGEVRIVDFDRDGRQLGPEATLIRRR